jgi:hypothetical protein
MNTLILPVCGKSSRFPGVRPKFLLTHPSGNSILTEAIRGLDLKVFDKIAIVGLQCHQDEYGYVDPLIVELDKEYDLGDKLQIVLLKTNTDNQPSSVVKGIEELGIEGQISIKDCDNYFKVDRLDNNFVGVYGLDKLKSVNANNKSYIKFGSCGEIVNIVEKYIISNEFCCGIYGFKDAKDFVSAYYKLKECDNLYISHIIYQLILDGTLFFAKSVDDYVDWGTLEDWQSFIGQYATLFVDIDGVLVENSGKLIDPKWGDTKCIKKNVDLINKLYDSGKCYIILTTTRDCQSLTENQLKQGGLKGWHRLIMGLPYCKRVLINDYSDTNPYPSAIAINLERNNDKLEKLIR